MKKIQQFLNFPKILKILSCDTPPAPNPQMKTFNFENFHLRVGAGECRKTKFSKFSESSKIFESFSYLRPFRAADTREDISTWILLKNAKIAFLTQNRQNWPKMCCFVRKRLKTPKNGRNTPKIFLVAKWVQKDSRKKMRHFYPYPAVISAILSKISAIFEVPRQQNGRNFGQNRPKNNICWKIF